MRNRSFAPFRQPVSRRRRRGSSRLFVLGAAVAVSTVGVPCETASAQTPSQQGPSDAGEPQARQVQRFDIREGPLTQVLAEFERVTGIKHVLADPGLGLITSPGVVGNFAPAEALRRLLSGTSVGARFETDGLVRLDVGGVSELVTVEGGAPSVASPKFTEPLRDIPQTINVIPQAMMQEQGATTLRDVLRNVVGITFQAGEGGVPAGDQLTIRGFSARTDMFVDGVRDFGGYSRDAFNLEQVEVAKGPASSVAGRGSTGGTINQVSKAPRMERTYDASVGFGNGSYKRTSADLNHPVGENAAFRLNAMWTDTGVPGRDVVEGSRWGVAPSLAFGVTSPTGLTISHMHLEQDNVPEYGLPWVPENTNPELSEYSNGQPPVRSSNFYGLVNRDYESTSTDVTSVQLDHRVSERLTLRNLTRYGRNDRDSVITAPRFASVNTSTLINRQLQSRDTVDTILANQTNASGRFATGTLRHAVSVGLELSQETSENFARSGPTAPQANLYDPNPDDPYPGPIVRTGASTSGVADSVAAYAFDTVNLHERLEVTGGLRWDRFDAETDSVATTGVVTSLGRVDHFFSWRGGVVYKPKENGSLYVGYGTSANPSAEGLALSASTVLLEPEKSRTLEIGTKWDVMGGRLSPTAAVFRTVKTNARTPGVNPGDPPAVLAGEQVVRGIELGLSGRVTREWSVFSGYAFLDSVIEESNTPAEVDNALALTPEHTLSLWSTYDLPKGISLGGGVQYMDAVFRNATNTSQVPSYWLTNALASYRVNELMTLRLNGTNLFDVEYVDRIGGGHYIPGSGRQVMLSSDFNF